MLLFMSSYRKQIYHITHNNIVLQNLHRTYIEVAQSNITELAQSNIVSILSGDRLINKYYYFMQTEHTVNAQIAYCNIILTLQKEFVMASRNATRKRKVGQQFVIFLKYVFTINVCQLILIIYRQCLVKYMRAHFLPVPDPLSPSINYLYSAANDDAGKQKAKLWLLIQGLYSQ